MTRNSNSSSSFCDVATRLPFIAVLVFLSYSASPLVVQALVINWTGGAGSSNKEWSNLANFTGSANPSGNDIIFDDVAVGSGAGVVSNIVNANVSIASLRFTKSIDASTTTFHTTRIDGGATLTITGGFNQGVPFAGIDCNTAGECAGRNTNVTFTGGGSLNVGSGSGSFNVGIWSGNWSFGNRVDSLDMAGLASFGLNTGTVTVGFVGAANPGATFRLADTNVITANLLDMARWNDRGFVELGRVNTLNINTIAIAGNLAAGNNDAQGTIKFQTGLSNPSVIIRNAAGTGAATLNMSKGGQSMTSVLDLTGGAVDALFGTITMTEGGTNPAAITSTLTFNQGQITATAINMSRSGNLTSPGTYAATINANGTGTLTANTISMSQSANSTGSPSTYSSTLNISNSATVIADTISLTSRPTATNGNTSATINLNNSGVLRATTIQRGLMLGSGTSTVAFNFNGGTLANKAGTDLTVASDVPINILTAATHNFLVDANRTMTINSNIVGGGTGAVNKTGAGTMLMLGTNSYTAATNVLAGTLKGTGAAASDFTVAAGATLAPGASPGTLLTDDLTMQAGSNLEIEIGGLTPGTQFDQILAGGTVNLNGHLLIKLIDGFAPTSSNSFTIIDGASVIGEFASVTVVGAQGYFQVNYLSDRVILSNFQVPEPSSFSLLAIASLGLVRIARRKKS